MEKTGKIYGINGPVIYIKGKTDFKMGEMVYVSSERLVGEVISLTSEMTTIQVYEETSGLKPGELVYGTDSAIFVTLAPGILNNIFDGIERPLSEIQKQSGAFISRGVNVNSLDINKKWNVHITVSEGDYISGGTIIAETQETRAIMHKSMVPPTVSGTVIKTAPDGEYTINDTIVTIKKDDGSTMNLSLTQKLPIRQPRPITKRFGATQPLVTGQRIMDTLFPLAKVVLLQFPVDLVQEKQ